MEVRERGGGGRRPARDTLLCLFLRRVSGVSPQTFSETPLASTSSHAQVESEVSLTIMEYPGSQGGPRQTMSAHCLTKDENECQEEETVF